jgi:uncharacterized protein YgfB (UPF0149 family)
LLTIILGPVALRGQRGGRTRERPPVGMLDFDFYASANGPMSHPSHLPDFDHVERALLAVEALGAAEAHGVITGTLCAPQPVTDMGGAIIFADAISDDPTHARQVLAELGEYTRTRLAERASEFTPLLPAEQNGIAASTVGLADFCRGFVVGLVAGGVQELDKFPEPVREVVDDFMQIGEAEAGIAEADTEEQALAELIEYVRVSVQLVYEELHPLN